MKRVMVRYKVKPDQAAKNEALVRAVYEELHRTNPAGLRYETLKLEDGTSFIHIASTETEDGHNPLSELKAFQDFQEGIGDATSSRSSPSSPRSARFVSSATEPTLPSAFSTRAFVEFRRFVVSGSCAAS